MPKFTVAKHGNLFADKNNIGFSEYFFKFPRNIPLPERTAVVTTPLFSFASCIILSEIWEDEFVNLQARFKKGIFSNETALFLWDLTDRTPNKYDMTFPHNYNLTNVKSEGVNCSRVKQEWYTEGKTQLESPGGNKITVYNMERTLCDILRKRGGTNTGIITEAFKRYTARNDKNIPLLSEYAKRFRVEEKRL